MSRPAGEFVASLDPTEGHFRDGVNTLLTSSKPAA
jgi:hypothetical protein